jgi:class 3 adenylate cyclase/tetratricopeptide (TPR) repeat protein
VRCPSCGFENPSGLEFCGSCGTALARSCPTCGFENPPEFKFCGKCGAQLSGKAEKTPAPEAPAFPAREPRDYTPNHLAEKILQSKSALEGERKQVTVLFADVKGSLELAEQVDPEEWHRILDRFFQILADGVHRFEGTINQYTGDGIMALFGAPIAHEDHAQRACYAALHLRGELKRYADELRVERGLSFSTRMGINSGEVVVGKIGDDLRMDYTAQGHTVGLAARMEELAAPDRAYLTQHTAALVSGYFDLNDLGASRIRGQLEPVGLFELEDVGPVRTRLERSRTRGFSKFVGRGDEMARLEAALERAIEGSGEVVGIVGEAGVGKSRLCWEFQELCRARGIPVRRAGGFAHGKFVPLFPVLEFFRDAFGVAAHDSDRAARQKIAGAVVLLDEELRGELPLLLDFLGVPDPERPAPALEVEARQRRLLGLLKRLSIASSEREPAVLIFEDLHWIDSATEAFVEALADATEGARTLMLVNFRPEYRSLWMSRSYYQQLALRPLDRTGIEELLDEWLGSDPSLRDVASQLAERTGGNPFFIEEVVQELIEAGELEGARGRYRLVGDLDRIEIPATVHSVIAARIDRLPERDKQVLWAASVIGNDFEESLLERVAELSRPELGEALHALVQSEFLYERALYPQAEYAFKHPLTQEVAYRSQLSDRRASLHATVARAIAARLPGELDERAALIADHWDRAGEALEAAEWHRHAALWVGNDDVQEALRHSRRMRELLARVPESPRTTTLGLQALTALIYQSSRLGVAEEDISALLAEGRALALRGHDDEKAVSFLAMAGIAMWNLGRLGDSGSLIDEARALSDRIGGGLAAGLVRLAQALTFQQAGRLSESLAAAEEGLELQTELYEGGPTPKAAFQMPMAWTLTWVGRLREAARALDLALERASEEGSPTLANMAHVVGVDLATRCGDIEGALAHGRRAVEFSEQIGSRAATTHAYLALGRACVAAGRWDAALDLLGRALDAPRIHGIRLAHEPAILSQMALAYARLGDAPRARELARQAVPLARERLAKIAECEAELARTEILLRLDEFDARTEIEAALDTASALAAEMDAKSFEPFIFEQRSRLARAAGDEETTRRHLRDAHRFFSEMGATGHAERLARELES